MPKKTAPPLETGRPRTRERPFPPRRDYSSLSVRDLLEARDAYHVHLSTLENVVATAIGRYLIHEDDWYAKHPPDEPRQGPRTDAPRRLDNTVLRPWSWPSVLVFVRTWKTRESLGSEAVPRTLYLPDGRVVPVCVVEAPLDERPAPPALGPFQVSELLGGGYSCLRRHQGENKLGTIGCLVRKSGTYYALTNRHVAGGEGEAVQAFVHGEYRDIGKASNIGVDQVLLSAAFPDWSAMNTYLRLDAGLIRIDDIRQWTSQVWGVGEIGEMFNATPQTISLDLIGCPLRGFGGTSGVVEGEIRALFYRYQSLSSFEFATDLLIGPRTREKEEERDKRRRATGVDVDPPPITRPGDSGTFWFYDPPFDPRTTPQAAEDLDQPDPPADRGKRARRLRPIAMQWGGERFILPDGSTSAFALASFVSTICRTLEVEVVRNWSIGHDEYWGKTGHFAIGWKACDRLTGQLGVLMSKNQRRIGFGDERLGEGSAFKLGVGEYVPLSDVPDYVWLFPRGDDEAVQHFADIDIRAIDGAPTMLSQCVADPKRISATLWKAYFDGFDAAGVGPGEGCLPFRVWQIFEDLVQYRRKKDTLRFVAAAGILAHYIGDASQPLHGSFMHHGLPPMKEVNGRNYPVKEGSKAFKDFKKTPASEIHSIYEQRMLEVDTPTALQRLNAQLQAAQNNIQIATGHEAAAATIALMHAAQKRLSPKTLINADDPTLSAGDRADRLWNTTKVRNATIKCLADSVRLLANLWQAAWDLGGGDGLADSKIVRFTETRLANVYRTEADFLPSLSLVDMVASGRFEPPS